MFGLGTALAYVPPLSAAMRWFPRKKGLVNGIIVGGFGLGAFVFNQVCFVVQYSSALQVARSSLHGWLGGIHGKNPFLAESSIELITYRFTHTIWFSGAIKISEPRE